MPRKCPLPKEERQFRDAGKLLASCKLSPCKYWDSDLDGENLPLNCLLLVAALLECH